VADAVYARDAKDGLKDGLDDTRCGLIGARRGAARRADGENC
jgi:hypothetical protein